MYIGDLVQEAQLFLLVFARVMAVLQIAPLLSSTSIPQIGRIGLAFFTAIALLPMVYDLGYVIPENGIAYMALLLGEALLGVIIGFILILIYSTFQLAGQFFSVQMGFGASQVYDPLAQTEIPLMGQFLNMIAMLVLISSKGFQKIFLYGFYLSFKTVKAIDVLVEQEYIVNSAIADMMGLFEKALIIAFPILGTLLMISVTMGLLAKAAPQMNLMMLGFPLQIGIAFVVLFIAMPFIIEGFSDILDTGFDRIEGLFKQAVGGGGAL